MTFPRVAGPAAPGLRLALGLGDQELEQRLRPALELSEEFTIVAQCLAADQLLELVAAQAVDAVVVAWTLHRLTDAILDQLDRPGLILLLLVPDPADARWEHRVGSVMSIDSDAEAVLQAILGARPGLRGVNNRPATRPEPVVLKSADRAAYPSGGVIAVAGGAGSPGRTTVALNLAVALGAAASCVLVELDLSAPALAAYVDADPSRNLCTLAHAVREDPRAWDAALVEELQPVGTSGSRTVLLCGPPKREMRASVGSPVVERLLDELAQRYRWVIVDVGAEWLGTDTAAASHRAALSRAHHVLLVSAADFVGVWHARTAIDQLERLIGINRRTVHLVLNRHDPRFHHSRDEVEWHLGAPVVAVIPQDHTGLQRAIGDQRPCIVDRSSRAGRALLALAEGLNDGKLSVPLAGGVRRRWWQRLLRRGAVPVVTRQFVRADAARDTSAAGATRSQAW